MEDRITRMRGLARVALIAMIVGAIPSNVAAQISAKVVEVAITGNVNINTAAIMNAVSLKPGDVYTDTVVDKDKASIISLGYFSAVTVHKQDVEGGVKVVYEVTENPKITGIKITGNEPIPTDAVLGLMKTKTGQVLNATVLNQDIAGIQDYYGEKGYVAYVTEEVGVNPQNGALTVPILVHRVESVEIKGNKKTRSWVFLREMKTKPGTISNRNTFRDDLMRIYNLDILEDIKQYEINPGSEIGLLKVVIPVVEKKTGQVSLGFGYSSRQRLVGQMSLRETNFRGLGQGLNLSWEQGTTEAVGGSASYELSFLEPWIDKKHTSLDVSLYNRLLYRFSSGIFNSGTTFGEDKFYNERHKGGELTVSRPLNDRLRVYVGGKLENVDADPGLLLNPDGTISNLVNIVQTGSVGSGSLRLVNNTRDQDINPAVGGYDALSLELGTVNGTQYSATGGPTVNTPLASPLKGSYEKTSIDIRRYFSRQGRRVNPQDKRTTVAVRLRAGFASGALPYFEQFFVGGADSLRGYREDRFWGTSMILGSVELRQPISQGLIGVVFADYGSAWGTASEFSIPELPQSNAFNAKLGVGIGMRVSTPIGNIRLDYGMGSEGSRTHFSMGQTF